MLLLFSCNMKEVSMEEIRAHAHKMHAMQEPWHFHMLSSHCILNAKKRYAFVFEGKETLVFYSETPQKEAGKALVTMLDKHVKENGLAAGITAQAKLFIEQGEDWHHHKIYPHCVFNKHPGKWGVLLERDETVIEQFFDEEPDICKIETLFYSRP